MVSGYDLLVFGSITVGISWLIGVACLYQKYKSDQKTCTVADFLKLTFSALTVVFSGYAAFTIFLTVRIEPQSLAEKIAPLMDKSEGYYFHPRGHVYEPGNWEIDWPVKMEREARAKQIDRIVAQWFSNITVHGVGSVREVGIQGPAGYPMDVTCTLSYEGQNVTAKCNLWERG